jgi:RNA polymerase sporulation-specific sigma factor
LKDSLSGFEFEVFNHMVNGLTYKDIAEKLEKKVKSVDNAIQRIKRKSESWLEMYK